MVMKWIFSDLPHLVPDVISYWIYGIIWNLIPSSKIHLGIVLIHPIPYDRFRVKNKSNNFVDMEIFLLGSRIQAKSVHFIIIFNIIYVLLSIFLQLCFSEN